MNDFSTYQINTLTLELEHVRVNPGDPVAFLLCACVRVCVGVWGVLFSVDVCVCVCGVCVWPVD